MQWYCLGCKLAHEETESNCKTCRDVNPAEQSISEESLRKSCLGYIAGLMAARTTMPTFDEWEKSTTGTGNARRSASKIEKVDTALKQFWSSLASDDRENSIKKLGEVAGCCNSYLAHKLTSTKEGDEARVTGAKRLQLISEREMLRFDKTWVGKRPPLVLSSYSFGISAEANKQETEEATEASPALGDDISELELRTLIPPFWGWFEMSKGARGKSEILRVDEALQAFWQTFRKDNRSATLRALETLRDACEVYLKHKEVLDEVGLTQKIYQYEGPQQMLEKVPRLAAAIDLMTKAIHERNRLEWEWHSGDALPPIRFRQKEKDPTIPEQKITKESLLMNLPTVADASGRLKQSGGLINHFERRNILASVAKLQIDEDFSGILVSAPIAKGAAFGFSEVTVGDILALSRKISSNIEEGATDPAGFLFPLFGGYDQFSLGDLAFVASLLTVAAKLRQPSLGTGGPAEKESLATKVAGVAYKGSEYLTKGEMMTEKGVKELKGKNATLVNDDVAKGFERAGAVFGILAGVQKIKSAIDEKGVIDTIGGRFEHLKKTAPEELPRLEESFDAFKFLSEKIKNKLGNRSWRAFGGGAAGVLAVSKGVAVLAASAAATPIGWLCSALSVGMTAIAIARRQSKAAKLKSLRDKYDIPSFVATTGEWYRLIIADLVVRSAYHDPLLPDVYRDLGWVLNWILLGGDKDVSQAAARQMGHAGIMQFLKG